MKEIYCSCKDIGVNNKLKWQKEEKSILQRIGNFKQRVMRPMENNV